MPITKSAQKKLKQDKKRTENNRTYKNKLKKAVKAARVKPNEKNLAEVYKALDKAARKKVIHKRKAARLKSRLSKQLKKK